MRILRECLRLAGGLVWMFTAACRLCMSLVVFGVQIDAGGLDRRVPQILVVSQ
jgi:hypothetical protein